MKDDIHCNKTWSRKKSKNSHETQQTAGYCLSKNAQNQNKYEFSENMKTPNTKTKDYRYNVV